MLKLAGKDSSLWFSQLKQKFKLRKEQFFSLPFPRPEEVDKCFVKDLMAVLPNDKLT